MPKESPGSLQASNNSSSRAPLLPLALAACVVALVAISYAPILRWLLNAWNKNPDMSHGFLVPVVAGVLLWIRREMRPTFTDKAGWFSFALGAVVVLAGVAMRCAGIYYRAITIESVSLLPLLVGITLCAGGFRALRWGWPALVFLIFMFPLPRTLGNLLSANLQSIATMCSTYLLQVIGIPAVSQGNVISLTTESIGVAEACNGLRMLTSFCALTMAACFILDRPLWQKVVLLLSAPAIGIAANVFRIAVTGIAFEYGDPELASTLFHDLAGWLMMPVAMVLVALELWLLSKVMLPRDDDRVRTPSTKHKPKRKLVPVQS